MLNRIIAFSLRNRLLVIAAAIGLIIYGGAVSLRLPIDVLPDLTRPTVTIMTEAHGLVPEEVEQLVTLPLEQSLVGATGVTRVRSTSGMGLSVVYVEFEWNTDIYRNRQIVTEKIEIAQSRLPADAVPVLAPVSSLMGQIQLVGVASRSGETTPEEIRAYVDRFVRPRLLAVKGVAQVVSTGGSALELQAVLDADRLRAHRVTLETVRDAIVEANVAASGGILPQGSRAPLITATGRIETPDQLAASVVKALEPRPVRMEDVGEVRFGPAAIRTGAASVDTRRGVIIAIAKQPGMDTLVLSKRVEAELEHIRATLPGDYSLEPALYRQADFIQRAIDNVGEAIRDGAILVLVVLVLFLLNLRTTFITLTAIPLSLATTALVFEWFGVGINTMTLGGIAVAIGALVDDAIVDVENVFRRLRQNAALDQPRTSRVIVFLASSEVRGPILIGTGVVIAVYFPLFAMSGMEGRLFAPVGVAYIISILASLIVALTVTPVLCSLLLPNSKAITREKEGPAVRAIKASAAPLIRFSLAHPRLMAGATGGLTIIGLLVLTTLGTEFLPPFNEGTAQVNLVLPSDTSLEKTEEVSARMDAALLEIPGIGHVGRRTGRAEGDEHAMPVNVTETIVSFDPDSTRPREDVLHDIRETMNEHFPGATHYSEQPIAHMLSHMLSGVNAQVAIKIYGPDLPTLRRLASETEGLIADIQGVVDLSVEPQVLVDRVEVRPRREVLQRVGLTVDEVAHTVELALEGMTASTLLKEGWRYPITMRMAPRHRRNLEDIKGLLLQPEHAPPIRLGDVADVRYSLTPNNISHEDASRRIAVQLNVEGRSLGEVVGDIERTLAGFRERLPAGYGLRISGQFEAQQEAERIILALSFVSLLVMFLLLFVHFRSANLAIQTLLNIPAAFIGAVAFLYITDQTLSIATLVGFVALGGITARNGILLIDHYLHLIHVEGRPFSMQTLIEAGQERVIPVLMTALTSGIALVPLVLAPEEPGRELLYPVASVILGGLVTTTLLDLLLTPGVFWLFGRTAAERPRMHTTEERTTLELVESLEALETPLKETR